MGIELALRRPVDIAINHDPEAVAMHMANHPHTRHYTQDIWSVTPSAVTKGRPVALAWFSPDCKHFSKAKGGKPVEKGIRDLAWVVVEWARAVRPAVIMLENVEEFRSWGPLDADGMPIKAQRGETWNEWLAALRDLGYEVQFRELRACDFGAPTSRKRLFVIARCDGEPITWPSPTHGRGLLPYRTAAECIDWQIPCPSIFLSREEGRRIGVNRPLVDATMRRIAAGIKRFVIDNPRPFIVPLTHRGGDRYEPIDEPVTTITAAHRGEKALVTPYLVGVTHNQSSSMQSRADEPMRTLTTSRGGEFALVAPTLVTTGHGEREGQAPRAQSVERPLGTVAATAQNHGLVAAFLTKYFTGVSGSDMQMPMGTVTSWDHHGLVAAHLAKHFTGQIGVQVEHPLPTITGRNQTTKLVTSNFVKLYGTNEGAGIDQPMPTITAGGQHLAMASAFLAAYYGNDRDGQAVNDPFRTVTSKERFGLVMVEGEPYAIVDIGMRMLAPRELFRAQGFPDGYIIDPLVGAKRLSKTAQIRMCGNSVCPSIARALVEANVSFERQGQMWRGYELAAVGGGS